MKYLTTEWRHLDIEESTCVRCSATGKTLQDVVSDVALFFRKRYFVDQ